ncbi:Alpha/Beta hydrolase protein [Globomyces pollinis-pini]|nr:Alpha/Beta hydrolase protein [Globomyces pollinis-pini]
MTNIPKELYETLGAKKLIRYWNYRYEYHSTITKDGYQIGLHRIPCPRDQPYNRSKCPVLLWHGLSNSSEIYIAGTPDSSLAFVLADAGFDVWLGNSRGSKYSNKHSTFNLGTSQGQKDYWNFNIEHLALYDLKSSVDYILSITESQKLSYIGFSQGSAKAFMALSLDEELNHQINHMIGLAPALKPRKIPGSILSTTLNYIKPSRIFNILGSKDFFPIAHSFRPSLLSIQSNATLIRYTLYLLLNWKMKRFGNHQQEWMALQNIFSTTSVQNVVHWFQILGDNRFASYREDENVGVIHTNNRITIPNLIYPTRHITTSITLFCGKDDNLSDIVALKSHLPDHTKIFEIDDYEHLDLIWSHDAPDKIFHPIIKTLKTVWNLKDKPISKFHFHSVPYNDDFDDIPKAAENASSWELFGFLK